MQNDIFERFANRMDTSRCPIPFKLILREFFRPHNQPVCPSKVDIREIPKSAFQYMRLCGTTIHAGKCVKENEHTIKHICAKLNRVTNDKAVGLTISDTISFSRKWSTYPSVITSTKFVSIMKSFLGISAKTLYTSAVELLSMSYSSICVFLTNQLSEKLYRELKDFDGLIVTAVTQKDITDIGIAEDRLEFSFKQRPEVFLSCELSMNDTHIFDLGGVKLVHLPFHNMFSASCNGFEFERDICLNVIPKLEKQGVKVMVVRNPEVTVKRYRAQSITPEILQKCTGKEFHRVKQFLGEYSDDILDALWNSGAVCLQHHIIANIDYQNNAAHYVSGERYTAGNRYNEKRSVYFYGPCIVRGSYVTDQQTIPSIFRNINEKLEYVVHNLGGPWSWMGYNLRTQIYRKGDIVILFSHNSDLYERYGIKLTDISKAYYDLKSDLSKCICDRPLHCNGRVNRNIATLLYSELEKRDWLEVQNDEDNESFRLLTVRRRNSSGGIYIGKQHELKEWLCRYKHPLADGTIGAICMNCNPMTNGHLYLIETAARSVDFLYIFILEEDKSVFRFEDRIQLVRDAVTHLPNVSVVPSGKFIISTSTLPGYFDKQNLQASIVDASYDLELFAESIAPALGITMRFAGEEPLDKFTAQYNYHMRKMLPLYGISFVEIPRKMSGNEVISASRVRKLMQQNQWEDIKHIVPDNVYQFLLSME